MADEGAQAGSTAKVTQKSAPPIINIDDGREKTWRDKLICTKAGIPQPLLFNALMALREAEVWRGTLRYDASALVTLVFQPTPWDRHMSNTVWEPRPWTDHDCTKLCEWLQRNGINVSSGIAAEAAQAAAKERQYHPIKDYLIKLKWDGLHRLQTWLHAYMGVENTPYAEAVGTRWMVSGVARTMKPGCQADHVLTLQGPQGIGKSTAFRVLAGDDWFTDEVRDFGNKDTSMLLCGRWLVELAELEGMNESSNQRCKAFISRRVDQFRPPYGRHTIDVPRQCIFGATTNMDAFLRDETGNRRYWPVTCTRADTEGLKNDRNQLWAEAKHLYDSGQRWWLDTPELRQMADTEQDARFETDPWEEKITAFLVGKKESTPEEILESSGFYNQDITAIGKRERTRVSAILRHLGWERVQVRSGNARGVRVWRPKNGT